MGSSNISKKFSYRDTVLEFDTSTKDLLAASAFRSTGIAGTNLTDATTELAACLKGSRHVLTTGFKMLENDEMDVDADEVFDESDFDDRSADEIFEAEMAEEEALDLEDRLDEVEASARRHRPDNSEGVIQAIRGGEGPSGIDRQAYGHKLGQVLYIPGGLFGSRRRDDRRVIAAAPIQTYAPKAPVTEHAQRKQVAARLESAGMKPGKAAEVASKAKLAPSGKVVGTLGAKLAAKLAESGALEALSVKAAPAPHRRRVVTPVTPGSANA